MNCLSCRREIPDDAVLCPYCGHSIIAIHPEAKPPAQPAAESKKKSNLGIGLLLISVVGAILCIVVLGQGGSSTTTYEVEYTVKGTARSASLTYENASGNTEQREVNLPWHLTFDAEHGQFLYVSAQNATRIGSVTCEIAVNGERVETATSSGEFVIASCSRRAGD